MEKVTIGIEKRVSLAVLELALGAVLDGSTSSEYFLQLAMSGCTGANRAKKTVALLNRLTIKSKLMPYLTDNKELVQGMLRNKADKSLLFTAMMCSSYTIFYDTMVLLGKFLHVQDEVGRPFLLQKLSEKYGSNRSLDVAFDCVMPMLIEAGIIKRSGAGIYGKATADKYSEAALSVYNKAFLLNNPTLKDGDDFGTHPFFEFVK